MGKEMTIKVLGSGCPTCKKLYKRVLKIAGTLGVEEKVQYITDMEEIIKMGIMSTPAFTVNNRIVTAGRIPSDEVIREAISS